MASKEDLLKQVDEEFEDDLESLEGCRKLKERMEARLKILEEEITLSNENSSIGQTVEKAEDVIRKIDEALVKSSGVSEEIEECLKTNEETRSSVQQHFNKLNTLQSLQQYLRVLQYAENLSVQLQKQIANKDDELCTTIFANLCEVFRNLLELPPTNLCKHIKEIVLYWHDMLKEKFAKDLNEIMTSLKWPFVNQSFSQQTHSQVLIKRLQIVAEYLLQIELPSECVEMAMLTANFPPLCLPIHYLVVPLKKRFLYHFYGARQTNRIDKPEWYFTQVLAWIRDHKDFVHKWIQPVINKFGFHHIEADVELMRGLVQLAIEKLQSDLPSLQYDDYTFSHSIDEALGFHKELIDNYSYPPHQPSILAVLTQPPVLVKWLAMEKKYAMEKIETMLLQSTIDSFQASEVDDLKITGCADTFITLLQTITERYENLPQPGHRLQFLDLQLELLDDFRIRLLQIAHEEQITDIVESKIPMIANTLFYIENVLLDWGAMLHYLNLFYFKTQMEGTAKNRKTGEQHDIRTDFDDSETETVFEETLSLYRRMRKELLCTLSEFVMVEIKNRSKVYRSERWFLMENSNRDFKSLSLTPSACPMFEIIGTRLHQLQKSLTAQLFRVVWRFIAQQLDAFLFEDLVLENRFSEAGALQLKYDVCRNLLPLFAQFSERPESYFTQLIESCTLLNISKGSALLLRETLQALEGATGVEDIRGKALTEIGVANFPPKMALNILNRRTDITVNRMVVD